MEQKLGKLWFVFAVAVLFVFSLGSGCANKEEKKGKHLERARQYVEANELKKAVIEFKNVVQLDPKNDSAYYELGDIYLKLKQGSEAFQSFSRAASVNPDNLKAQLKVGQMFLLGKNTEEARKKAELVLEKSPDNVEALSLLSGVQIQEKDPDAAIATLEKAASIDPKDFKIQLSLARMFLLKQDFDSAEKAYLRAVSLNSDSHVAYIELSRLYGTKGEWDKAESELKKMIRASGSSYRNLYVLARFYESRKKWDLAEKTYLEAVESTPKEDVSPLMNLGAYYGRRDSYDQALEAMEKASAAKEDDLNILAAIAQLHFDFKKTEEAESVVDKILEKDQGHVNANFLKGRLEILRKDFTKAGERFDLVVRERPRSDMAHYFKALALFGKGEGKLAQQELVKTVELNPRHLDARLILVETYLRERNKELARQQIDSTVELAPRNERVLMLQGDLKILERDAVGAEAAFKKVVELYPDHAPAYIRLGSIYLIQKKPEEARKSFEMALELNPQQVDAMASLVGIHVQNKKFDAALEVCDKQKQKLAENVSGLALIEYLEGNVFLAQKDLQKARERFETAIEKDPNVLAPYVALARIYVHENKLDDAVTQYETIIGKDPKYLAGYMTLGTIYEQQGDGEKAEQYYRKALEINKDFAPAANNLAWNLAERGKNIDEALGFAQAAKEKMTENAAVMDTLGWIYYLKGSYLSAIEEFRDSVTLDPENPVLYYHLGLAYRKNNQPEKARESLERALKIDKNFKWAEEARKALSEMSF